MRSLRVPVARRFRSRRLRSSARSRAAEQGVASALDDYPRRGGSADEDRYFRSLRSWRRVPRHRCHGALGRRRLSAPTPPALRAREGMELPGRARNVSVRGESAWFTRTWRRRTWARLAASGVLSLRDGRWLIEQYVLSITVPNERFRAVRELLAAAGGLEPRHGGAYSGVYTTRPALVADEELSLARARLEMDAGDVRGPGCRSPWSRCGLGSGGRGRIGRKLAPARAARTSRVRCRSCRPRAIRPDWR